MSKAFTDRAVPRSMPAAMDRGCQEAPDHDQPHGGNLSGHDPSVEVFMVPDFQGMSGQGANQSTNRPKGST